MKTIITTAFVAATALTLAACGGTTTTTENVTVTNETVLEEGAANLTAVDAVNDSGAVLDNAVDLTGNAADATGNAVANATE